MPRPPRFRTPVIRELFAQLRFATAAVRRQQMDHAEQLSAEVAAEGRYPADFVSFRITGYRSDAAGELDVIDGADLLADLSMLVQHLSRSLELRFDQLERRALTLEAVRRRLGVSARTLHRYRRQGLVCHEIVDREGGSRLHCFEDALRRFERERRGDLRRAAAFSRMNDEEQKRLLERARTLRRDEGLSLNETARRLAPDAGRAAETIRGFLQRHDRRDATPIFAERGMLDEREHELVFRAWRYGVPPSRLARRLGKATSTIHHAINRMRRRRLVQLDVAWMPVPTFDLPEAESVILESEAVRSGLDATLDDDLLAHARSQPTTGLDENVEGTLLAAYNLLKRRAREAIDGLPEYPNAAALDVIETDLRWAAAVKGRVVAAALSAALRMIEQHLHRRLADEPAAEIQRLVRMAIDVTSNCVDRLDPGRQRLERACTFAMDRALARSPARPAGRAAARHEAGSLRLSHAQRRICPWQTWLDPPAGLRERLDTMPADVRSLLVERYGLDGRPPQTMAALARRHGTTAAVMGARLRAAERWSRAAGTSRRGRDRST